MDDRGIDDPSRNQDPARPVGTCSAGPLPSPCSPIVPHQAHDELSQDTAALHVRHSWCIQCERAAATDGRHMGSADRPPADVESQLGSDATAERDSVALNGPVSSRYGLYLCCSKDLPSFSRDRPSVREKASTISWNLDLSAQKSPSNLTQIDKQHTAHKLPIQCLRKAQKPKGQDGGRWVLCHAVMVCGDPSLVLLICADGDAEGQRRSKIWRRPTAKAIRVVCLFVAVAVVVGLWV